ncbi:S8 family serine peptidase [Pseudoalteromonas sp. OOF1S-7]|uniref:S8 family serine peptidase n=1 Tax=Pseudoalteromonas sp. OOF1S-7 TaxID=2917757 RepID=UPI001EF5FC18|nr:S8 family serine peptidase [Pseudoalteromonas sp. OOF1S-7]MCG7537463.1 S8 family serine peptidase [Pseudoalteromonas sp. OOF1S-7]
MAKYSFKATAVATAVSGALMAASATAATAQVQPSTSLKVSKVALEQSSIAEARTNAYLVVMKQNTAVDLVSKGIYSEAAAKHTYASVQAAQSNLRQQIQQLDASAKVLGSTKVLASTLIVEASDSTLDKLRNNAAVERILPLRDSQLFVEESSGYIGADAVKQNLDVTGKDVKVAVLDTGIDYTHKIFNETAGTIEAYEAEAADPTSVTWPQGQVKGGYDYVRNDADPIEDDPRFRSDATELTDHGTHVSHDVTGIAPDIELYVYSVCGGGCTWAAQINALEAAMDPNGDGDISDRVDLMNMSLGGEFGNTYTGDGTQYLIQRAVELGTNMIIAAGNDDDIPFRVGGPSTTPNAMSVASLTHPTLESLFGEGTIAGSETVIQPASFGPQVAFAFTQDDAELVYPSENQNGCDLDGGANPFESMDFTGKAVLIDRGACAFTEKVLNAQERGAVLVLIANNNDDGTPAPMGGSDAAVTIPSVGINFAAGDALKNQLRDGAATYSVSGVLKSTTGGVSGFSSRGPSMDGLLKPEIAAPGSNILAAAPATGDQLHRMSGTSMASPIVAGAVALMKEGRPELDAFEIKAMLMNTANLDIHVDSLNVDPESPLAPISRIGAGLINVEKAMASPVAAWTWISEYETNQGALSFGFDQLEEVTTYTKTVELKNFSDAPKTYKLRTEARYKNDEDAGALSWDFPAEVTVPAGQTIAFDVSVTVDPAKLPAWGMTNPLSADELGPRTAALTLSEMDGALVFDDIETEGDHDLHMVYHMLPKAHVGVELGYEMINGDPMPVVMNNGFRTLNPLTDQLIAVGEEASKEDKAFNILGATFNVFEAEGCTDTGLFFTASMKLRDDLKHLRQAGYQMNFDTNNDGTFDYALSIYNDVGRSAAVPGRGRTVSGQIVDGAPAWAFLSPMFHETGSGTVTFSGCTDLIGLTADQLGNEMNVEALVGWDDYQLGISTVTDAISGNVTFATSSATLVDAEGTEIRELAPGEKAYIRTDAPFAIADASGTEILAAVTEEVLAGPGAATPPMIISAMHETPEHTETGTVLGQVELEEQEGTLDVSEFYVRFQSNEGISVTKEGDIVVTNGDLLDYDAGVHQVELVVVAIDVQGNVSEQGYITVMITNEADTTEEQTPVIATEQRFEVMENAEAGTEVGKLMVMDQDGDLESFSIEGSSSFAIDAEGNITVIGPVDYDASDMIKIMVTAKDKAGNSSEAVEVIFDVLEDEHEGTPVIEMNQRFSVNENAAIGTEIGKLAFSDADGDVTQFAVTGTNLVAIDAEGTITVAGDIDFEYERVIKFNVVAVDEMGKSSEPVMVEVRVNDLTGGDDNDDDDSGSLAWLTLLAAPFAALRRRKRK